MEIFWGLQELMFQRDINFFDPACGMKMLYFILENIQNEKVCNRVFNLLLYSGI